MTDLTLDLDAITEDTPTVGYGVYNDYSRSFIKRLDRHDSHVFPTAEEAAEHAAEMVERHNAERRHLEIVPVPAGLSAADEKFDTFFDE